MSSLMPISFAMASRCRTAFVDPPLAATLAIVFSRDLRVMICEGRRLARTASINMRPAARVASALLGAVAGAGKLNRRYAENLSAHGHRVGRELAAAGAGAGTSVGFE